MNKLEKQMLETLQDLKDNHHVLGIKAEFEAEGTRLEEAMRLKEVVTKAGLEMTIKIGGCEAIKDMYDAKVIGVSAIVAPMIESPYAMEKFLNAVPMVFEEEEIKNTKFLINIESKYGFKYIDDMLSNPQANKLSGIVFGRTDMSRSLGLTPDDINSEEIFAYAEKIANKALEYHKELVIGGGVSAQSLPFFKRLPKGSLTRFETRKVIFDAQKTLQDDNAFAGILKAVSFELLWIKNKKNFYGRISQEDNKRIEVLTSRYEKSIKEVGGII